MVYITFILFKNVPFGPVRNLLFSGYNIIVMADVKVRDKFCEKFKIPHSYDHLVSTSGQCDAIKSQKLFLASTLCYVHVTSGNAYEVA